MRAKKPPLDEARGRRFAKLMENEWNYRDLTGRQIEQVLAMAARISISMRRAVAALEAKL